MELVFKFNNNEHNDTSYNHTFIEYYNWFINNHNNIETKLNDVSVLRPGYAGHSDSGSFLTITNPDNGKFIIVSMWDRNNDMYNTGLGWDLTNCVEIITSSGINGLHSYTPFTYLPYNKSFYKVINSIDTSFEIKQDLDLLFRGLIYLHRRELQTISPKNIIETTIPLPDYVNELAMRKINLSLNGAAEICHRDIEIISTGSVLLRPKLNVKFHNELIPWEHYIPFELDNSPKKQWEIITETFNSVRGDDELLKRISKNSLDWYYKNGTIESSVEILKNLININKLK